MAATVTPSGTFQIVISREARKVPGLSAGDRGDRAPGHYRDRALPSDMNVIGLGPGM